MSNGTSLITSPLFFETDSNNNPLAGGHVYTYAAGTLIPLATYTDSTLTVPNTNPVILDTYGRAEIWLGTSIYKINVTDINNVQHPDYPVDNLQSSTVSAATLALLASTAPGQGDALMGVLQPWAGAVPETQDFLNQNTAWLTDFGTPDRTGVVDSSAIFALANASGRSSIRVPSGVYKVSGNVIALQPGQSWEFDDVVLNWSGAGTQKCISCINVNDWAITGFLIINGTGMASGTLRGVSVEGGNRFIVQNVHCQNIPGWGFKLETGGVAVNPRGDKGQFITCGGNLCWIGAETTGDSTTEYTTWANFQASGNGSWGIIDSTGNTVWNGGQCVDNVLGGFKVDGGSYANGAHGCVNGMNINHNGSDNIQFLNVSQGYTVNACHIYGGANNGVGLLQTGAFYVILTVGTTDFTLIGAASNTVGLGFTATGPGSGSGTVLGGYIHFNNSYGITILGGIIDAPVYSEGGSQDNVISNNFIPVSGNFNFINGANSKLVLCFNNYGLSGPHINNEIGFLYISAYRGGTSQSLVSGTPTNVIFNTLESDVRSNFNYSTGIFTCPVSGMYRVSTTIQVTATGTPTGNITLEMNNGADNDVMYGPFQTLSTGICIASVTADLYLAAGNTLRIIITATGTSPAVYLGKSKISIEYKGGRTT